MNAERHLDHQINIEFIGTDIDLAPERRNRYSVKCSCNGIERGGYDSLSMATADAKITQHLKDVGLDKI